MREPAQKLIEICATSARICIEAAKRGAGRAELCVQLEVGGITPSYGEIAAVREAVPAFPVNVLIRPRAGDFVYTPLEGRIMLHDIEICKQLKVNGVVIGCLTKDGGLDRELLAALIAAAKPLPVTFHRAFDAVRDHKAALEELITSGCERILCSGGTNAAETGIPLLAELVKQAAGRLTIMPGGGIRAHNIQRIARETGARELHSSALDVLDLTLEALPKL